MKVFRLEEAAERLGLSTRMLELLEEEGRIKSHEKIGGVSYYSQVALDHLIHELHCTLQRASWNDMEVRMEQVERHVEALGKELRELRDSSTRLL